MKNYLLILLLLTGFCTSAHAEVPTQSGDLQTYLNGITFGGKDDGVFKIPTDDQLAQFESVVALVLHGNYELANTSAQQINSHVATRRLANVGSIDSVIYRSA